MRMSILLSLPLALALLATGCGGYTPPPAASAAAPVAVPAQGFVYTDPPAGGWALVKDASSTATSLVLNLVGPDGLMARGVGFNLATDVALSFHPFASHTYVNDTGVFQLKLRTPNRYTTDFPNFFEPVLLVGGVKNSGKLLTVGIFQKDRTLPAQALTAPLCQVGIDFNPAAGLASGTAVHLDIIRARIIPEDIGALPADMTGDFSDVLYKFRLVDIQVAVGTLTAQ